MAASIGGGRGRAKAKMAVACRAGRICAGGQTHLAGQGGTARLMQVVRRGRAAERAIAQRGQPVRQGRGPTGVESGTRAVLMARSAAVSGAVSGATEGPCGGRAAGR